ncbi:unnamed protein product [Periconia digitata]|uniref:Uncharacterized protein n=1 Tax=Periconia digitata TaxID=1303443 RepID=A0A9W4UFK4_9PLEO|nr:unnamed protein product [Periconia digitata]
MIFFRIPKPKKHRAAHPSILLVSQPYLTPFHRRKTNPPPLSIEPLKQSDDARLITPQIPFDPLFLPRSPQTPRKREIEKLSGPQLTLPGGVVVTSFFCSLDLNYHFPSICFVDMGFSSHVIRPKQAKQARTRSTDILTDGLKHG